MATPTPGKSQQGRTPQPPAASPPVSTPFSLGGGAPGVFSPHGGGPRSSPQQVRRSPATTGTLHGAPGSSGPATSAPMSFDSPSAAAAMGSLGMHAGLDIGLEGVGDGVGGLGLAGLGVLGGEDERLKRLDSIIGILSHKKGYVSEEGLERLVQRIGLDCIWDTHMDASGRKTKMLVVAGKALQLDIVLDNNIARSVALSFPLSAPAVVERVSRATAILSRDLGLAPGQSPLTKKLDDFWANLSRLAELDRLSVIPGLDLQEALVGMCSSLERVYRFDLERVRASEEGKGKGERWVHNTVTCHGHGFPVMHARNRVGLALEYWVQRHHVPLPADEEAEESEGLWSLQVTCAPASGSEMMYPPVRISDGWISDSIEKAEQSADGVLTAPELDWLEPAQTVLPPSEEEDGIAKEAAGAGQGVAPIKYPDTVFKALLEPPVILPQPVWQHMYQLVGAQVPPIYSYPTFDSLFFPIPAAQAQRHDPSAPRTIQHSREITCVSSPPRKGGEGGADGDRKGGREVTTKRCRNRLCVYKPVYGQVLSELPFAHPKQLIAALPILRQYALLATLLKRSFGDGAAGAASSPSTRPEGLSGGTTSPAAGDADDEEGGESMEVTLSVHPAPRLQVVFPLKDKAANVTLQVGVNGKIVVISENILPEKEEEEEEEEEEKGEGEENGGDEAGGAEKGANNNNSGKKKVTPETLAKALEVLEDLDQWCEWVRTRIVEV